MSGDSDDSRLPHMKLWFVDSSDFENIEGGRVEEIKRNEGCNPDSFMNPRDTSASRRDIEEKKYLIFSKRNGTLVHSFLISQALFSR